MLTLVNVMENINCYDLMLTKLTPVQSSPVQPVENFTSTTGVERTEHSFSYHFAVRNGFQLTRVLHNGKTETYFTSEDDDVYSEAKNIILIIKCENKQTLRNISRFPREGF